MDILKKIVPIHKADFSNYDKNQIQHKFLYSSLKEEIFVYTNKKNSENKIYDFFGVYFLIINENSQTNGYEPIYQKDGYKAYYFDKDLEEIAISQNLRSSKTLKITDINCYDNDDIKVVFSEKGFLVANKMNVSNEDKFERVTILYMLSLAYKIKAENLLQEVSKAYTKKSFEKMINLKDDIYAFDLNCYFFNPVLQSRHQVFTIWQIVSKYYFVEEVYLEIKTQVSDLTKIIEQHQKDKKEQREKRFETTLTYFGLFIAAMSAYPVIKDLFGF